MLLFVFLAMLMSSLILIAFHRLFPNRPMTSIAAAFTLVWFWGFHGNIAIAQDNSTALQGCVDYFTKGGPYEWIIGGALVIVLLLAALTKFNIPSFVKDMLAKLADRKKD